MGVPFRCVPLGIDLGLPAIRDEKAFRFANLTARNRLQLRRNDCLYDFVKVRRCESFVSSAHIGSCFALELLPFTRKHLSSLLRSPFPANPSHLAGKCSKHTECRDLLILNPPAESRRQFLHAACSDALSEG